MTPNEQIFWHAWTRFILSPSDDEAESWLEVMVKLHTEQPDLFSNPREWHAYQTHRQNQKQAAS